MHLEPMYEALHELKKLKANASVVIIDLGGGSNCQYGLVYKAAEYVNVNSRPYLHTSHLGVLTISSNVSQYDATRIREQHQYEITKYLCVCNHVFLGPKLGKKSFPLACVPFHYLLASLSIFLKSYNYVCLNLRNQCSPLTPSFSRYYPNRISLLYFNHTIQAQLLHYISLNVELISGIIVELTVN